MIINGERALAYIVTVDSVSPIEGADNIELAHVGGWVVIVKKGEVASGDPAVFFEIDSKLPETDERFKFLEPKHYKIKTMRLSKFGVFSQGLLLPLSEFPELKDCAVGTDVTKKLGVTYAVAEDNERKASDKPESDRLRGRHPEWFKSKPFRWLMRREWSRKILLAVFGRKKPEKRGWPDFVSKTDEERIENMPYKLGNGVEYIMTEKLDGTSCTYAMRKTGRNRFEFYVCSRNVRMKDENQQCYHDHNIYWDMAFKYHIEDVLKTIINTYRLDWACIQGEGVGTVQGNPLKLKEDDLYVFNLITSDRGRWGTLDGRDYLCKRFGMKWVPVLGTATLPDDMEEMKRMADGKSVVNNSVLREGIVYRRPDGTDSFKNVSRNYLLKHGG